MDTYLQVIQKYAVFSGRSARKEYWMFALINLIIAVAMGLVFGLLKGITHIDLTWLSHIYTLAVFCPSIAVGIRRLHDIDRSGWWMLIGLVPVVGSIVLLVFMCLDSTPGDNRFGSNPKAITANASWT